MNSIVEAIELISKGSDASDVVDLLLSEASMHELKKMKEKALDIYNTKYKPKPAPRTGDAHSINDVSMAATDAVTEMKGSWDDMEKVKKWLIQKLGMASDVAAKRQSSSRYGDWSKSRLDPPSWR